MPDPSRRDIDVHFPKKGVDLATHKVGELPVFIGPNQERHYSCADAQNVASWDSFAQRQRGGSRGGWSKWISALGTDYMTQDLGLLVVSPASVTPSGGHLLPISPTGEAVQPSQSGRVVLLVKVAAGKVEVASPGDTTWHSPTNNASNNPPLNASGLVYSDSNNQKQYFADGLTARVLYKPDTDEVIDWTTTDGLMPEDSGNGPRLIVTWRGRTLQSGIITDPHNIFASAVGLPRNYDYSPANPAATDAWALNLSDVGIIGDVVNSMIPCSDEVLVVLGDHTIEKLEGDPNNGGSRVVVSDAIGGVFGKAWCKGPDGTIYFFSNVPGIYALPPRAAGQPTRISQPIDPRLKDVNTGTDVIRFHWDDRRQGFWLFITSSDGTSGNHWFYEAVRPDGSGGGWYPVKFDNAAMNPYCGCVVDGNSADDRAVVIGGSDGYVRKADPSATDDDGTPIASYVLIGPIVSPNIYEQTLIALQGEFADGSADVQFDLLKGETAEEALGASPLLAVQDVFSEGRGYTKHVNRAAYAMYIKLSSVGRWAIERLRATLSTKVSKIRGRGK